VVRREAGTVTSLGYNVVDKAFGATSTAASPTSGFAASTNPATDKQVADLLTPPDNTTSPFVNAAGGNFAPVPGIKVINDALPAGYPVKDFFGNDREIPWAAGAVK
jgi:hypothetical protein